MEITERYLSKREVATLYGVTTRTIDDWTFNGRFPKPDRLPSGRPRWRESVVQRQVRHAS